MTEFEQRLADIHLSLYHLSLDAETTWEQSAMLWVIMDSFDASMLRGLGIRRYWLCLENMRGDE